MAINICCILFTDKYQINYDERFISKIIILFETFYAVHCMWNENSTFLTPPYLNLIQYYGTLIAMTSLTWRLETINSLTARFRVGEIIYIQKNHETMKNSKQLRVENAQNENMKIMIQTFGLFFLRKTFRFYSVLLQRWRLKSM